MKLSSLMVIFDPRFWGRNYDVSVSADDYIIDMITAVNLGLEEPKMANNGAFRLSVGDKSAWVRNFPYAFGQVTIFGRPYLPSRKVSLLLYKKLQQWTEKYENFNWKDNEK